MSKSCFLCLFPPAGVVAVKDSVPLSPLKPAAPADTQQQSSEGRTSALGNDLQPSRVSGETSNLRPQTPKAEDDVVEDDEASGSLTISELVYRYVEFYNYYQCIHNYILSLVTWVFGFALAALMSLLLSGYVNKTHTTTMLSSACFVLSYWGVQVSSNMEPCLLWRTGWKLPLLLFKEGNALIAAFEKCPFFFPLGAGYLLLTCK